MSYRLKDLLSNRNLYTKNKSRALVGSVMKLTNEAPDFNIIFISIAHTHTSIHTKGHTNKDDCSLPTDAILHTLSIRMYVRKAKSI